ncbi:MAG TPA: hypothetical protein VF003_10695, partial [Pseudonocardiaceae bacterium]
AVGSVLRSGRQQSALSVSGEIATDVYGSTASAGLAADRSGVLGGVLAMAQVRDRFGGQFPSLGSPW